MSYWIHPLRHYLLQQLRILVVRGQLVRLDVVIQCRIGRSGAVVRSHRITVENIRVTDLGLVNLAEVMLLV